MLVEQQVPSQRVLPRSVWTLACQQLALVPSLAMIPATAAVIRAFPVRQSRAVQSTSSK